MPIKLFTQTCTKKTIFAVERQQSKKVCKTLHCNGYHCLFCQNSAAVSIISSMGSITYRMVVWDSETSFIAQGRELLILNKKELNLGFVLALLLHSIVTQAQNQTLKVQLFTLFTCQILLCYKTGSALPNNHPVSNRSHTGNN